MAVNIIREIKPMKRKASPYKEDFAVSIPVSSMKDGKQYREKQASGCWHRVSFAVPFPVDGLSCG